MQARWKYVRNSTLVLFVIFCISIAQAAGLQGSRAIQANGNIGYSSFKAGVYTYSWNFNEYNASTIASTFDMSQSWCSPDWPQHPEWDYTAKMNQVHTLNPNYKALVYRNVNCIYDYWPNEWNYANSQGWLLKDASGNYVGEAAFQNNYMVDITNSSYQQWVGNIVASWIREYPFFDGVMADCSFSYSASAYAGYSNSTPINPSTGAPFTTQQILDGCVGTLNAIINAVGGSKLVLANGIWSGFLFYDSTDGPNIRYMLSHIPGLSCIMSEGTFYQTGSTNWYSEVDWQKSVDMIAWIQDNFLSFSSNRQFVAFDPAANSPVPGGTTKLDLAMFGFCSLMLGVKYPAQNNICFGDLSNDPALLLIAQQSRDLNLGTPMSNYYKVNSESLYVRDFQAGKVIVNPSVSPYAYLLDGSYNLINGTVVSGSLTVYAHSGVILFK